jgi:hypothetical protein
LSDTAKKSASKLTRRSATVEQLGKYCVIKLEGQPDLLVDMPFADARDFAHRFTDAADLNDASGLYAWLGSNSAVVNASREAFRPANYVGGVPRQNELRKSAIEHTDPFWRHLGVDETAGVEDIRPFEKTEHGFVRGDMATKEPGMPDEQGLALEQKKAEVEVAMEINAGDEKAADKSAAIPSDPKGQAKAIITSQPIN